MKVPGNGGREGGREVGVGGVNKGCSGRDTMRGKGKGLGYCSLTVKVPGVRSRRRRRT